MASTIAAITTSGGGVVTTADSSGNLSLLSGATTVVAVTSTGVAVTGTLSASGNLTGAAGSFTSIAVSGATTNTIVSSIAGTALSIDRSSSVDATYRDHIAFVRGGVRYGLIKTSTAGAQYDGLNASALSVGESPIAVATSTGLAVTGLVDISAATSGQIKFPATQNASANANTLDDYEEGTWTPVNLSMTTFSSVTGTFTYIKVGALVTVFFKQTGGTIVGVAGQGIAGLPFSMSQESIGYAGDTGPTADRGYILGYTTDVFFNKAQTGSSLTFTLTYRTAT